MRSIRPTEPSRNLTWSAPWRCAPRHQTPASDTLPPQERSHPPRTALVMRASGARRPCARAGAPGTAPPHAAREAADLEDDHGGPAALAHRAQRQVAHACRGSAQRRARPRRRSGQQGGGAARHLRPRGCGSSRSSPAWAPGRAGPCARGTRRTASPRPARSRRNLPAGAQCGAQRPRGRAGAGASAGAGAGAGGARAPGALEN